MPEIREVPLKEYEEMKKSYGFNDEQMKLIMKVAPMKRRWADGNVDEETEQKLAKPQTRQEQIANQIREELKKRTGATSNTEETQEATMETVSTPDVPSFNVPEDSSMNFEVPSPAPSFMAPEESMPVEEVPSFEVPTFEAPTFDTPNQEEEAVEFNAPVVEEETRETPVKEEVEIATDEPEDIPPATFEIPEFSAPSFEMPAEDIKKEEDTESFDELAVDFTAPVPVFTNDEVVKAEEKIADEFLKSEEGNQSTYQVPDFSEQSNSYDRNQMMIDGTKRLFQMMEEERLSLSNLGQTR